MKITMRLSIALILLLSIGKSFTSHFLESEILVAEPGTHTSSAPTDKKSSADSMFDIEVVEPDDVHKFEHYYEIFPGELITLRVKASKDKTVDDVTQVRLKTPENVSTYKRHEFSIKRGRYEQGSLIFRRNGAYYIQFAFGQVSPSIEIVDLILEATIDNTVEQESISFRLVGPYIKSQSNIEVSLIEPAARFAHDFEEKKNNQQENRKLALLGLLDRDNVNKDGLEIKASLSWKSAKHEKNRNRSAGPLVKLAFVQVVEKYWRTDWILHHRTANETYICAAYEETAKNRLDPPVYDSDSLRPDEEMKSNTGVSVKDFDSIFLKPVLLPSAYREEGKDFVIRFEDLPWQGLWMPKEGFVTGYSEHGNQFRNYLMFHPGFEDNLWIPLARVDWEYFVLGHSGLKTQEEKDFSKLSHVLAKMLFKKN